MNVLQNYSRELIAANNDSSEAPGAKRAQRKKITENRKPGPQEGRQTDQLSHWLDRVMDRSA